MLRHHHWFNNVLACENDQLCMGIGKNASLYGLGEMLAQESSPS